MSASAETRHRVVSRLALALRATAAAGMAWLAALPTGAIAQDYPYFAPLGAVIATSSTVAGSVREAAQGVAALLLGAAIALALVPWSQPQVIAVAIAVLVGSLLASWPRLGPMSVWVPLAAMYVLLAGAPDPLRYAVSYAGLVSLGAVVGVLTVAVLPSLPLRQTDDRILLMRRTLADQLDQIADALRTPEPPTGEEWEARHEPLREAQDSMNAMLRHTAEARRANWRARGYRAVADAQHEQARRLQDLAFLIEDLRTQLSAEERAEHDVVSLGPALRPCAADAIEATANVLRHLQPTASADELERFRRGADAALDDLARLVTDRWDQDGDGLAAAATVHTLRRSLVTIG